MSEATDFQQIKTSLKSSPYESIRKVTVRLDGHTIVLSGTVRSYYMKQVAQETARASNGNGFNGFAVQNRIEVVSEKE